MAVAGKDRGRGRLFVIAAPPERGKTSLVKALLERHPELHVSISHTTRARRPTEQPGREYYFVTVPEFQELIAKGEFLEYAQVFDNFYGTGRRPVEEQLAQGRNVILEIDWQGARLVRKAMPECSSIFILPPSRTALRRAAAESPRPTRPKSSPAACRDAVGDMSHWDEFDYVVVNDDFERAVTDLARIVDGDGEDLAADRKSLKPLLAELVG